MRHHGASIPLNRNHVFDSNGPDLRIRGTAQQLFEKYLQLGRDATSGGDRVMAESYFQHAEHYFRIINAMNQAQQQTQMMPPPVGASGPPLRHPMEADGAEPAGLGEQPGGAGGGPAASPMGSDAREIPISAAPPEGYQNGSDG